MAQNNKVRHQLVTRMPEPNQFLINIDLLASEIQCHTRLSTPQAKELARKLFPFLTLQLASAVEGVVSDVVALNHARRTIH